MPNWIAEDVVLLLLFSFDGDVPRVAYHAVYIPQYIRFTKASTQVCYFNNRNKLQTAKLLTQGDRYDKLPL